MTILPIKKINKENENENMGTDLHITSNSHLRHSHFNNLFQHNENVTSLPTRSRPVIDNTSPNTFDDNSPSTSFDILSHNDYNNQFKKKFKKSPNRLLRKAKNTHQNQIGLQSSSKAKKNNEDFIDYNSGDEYDTGPSIDPERIEEMEIAFQKDLQDKKGFQIKQMIEDGACLFRAVADQVYGDQDMHSIVRKHCMDYMLKNTDYFSQFTTENFEKYIARKCQENSHGNHLEIQAMAEMYNRPMEVYEYGTEPINIFHGYNESGNEPIRLSYHKNSHYNSVINPYKATIGVGLGMPSFFPGLADKNLVIDAVQDSENLAIEDTMLKDKLAATDWEATNKAIEEQVACESYLQWVKDMEKNKLSPAATSCLTMSPHTSKVNSTFRESCDKMIAKSVQHQPGPHAKNDESKRQKETNLLLNNCSLPTTMASTSHNSSGSSQFAYADYILTEEDTSSFISELPPETFGLDEWDDNKLLAQVLAVSQLEYMDQLKKSRDNS